MRRTLNHQLCESEDSCAKILNCPTSCANEDHAHSSKYSHKLIDFTDAFDSAISIENELLSDCGYCSSLCCDQTFCENSSDIMNISTVNTNDIHEDLREKLDFSNSLKSPCSSTTDSGLGVDIFSSSSEIDIQCNDRTLSVEERESGDSPSNDTPETLNSKWEHILQRDEDGDTILHLLVVQGFYRALSVIMQLIPQSSFLNVTNKLWQTPLHLAVLTDQPHIVRRFVIAGAQIDLQDHHGNTPLHLACATGKLSCVQALINPTTKEEIKEVRTKYSLSTSNYKIPYRLLDKRNFEGLSCIHLATLGRHTKVIRFLVLCGADVNAQEGKSGRTALHYATECQKLDLVHFLLSACKANSTVKNYAGFTPHHIALYLNKFNPSSKIYLKLIGLLKQHCEDIFELTASDSDSDGEQLTDEENDYNCQYLSLCP